ncbi:MAG: FkbM family methyltransferase [Balneolia bacterium]|nr:FkbM family methyltransferase [Balneolia bacterium]
MNNRIQQAELLLNTNPVKPDQLIKLMKPLVSKKNTPWKAYHISGIAHFLKSDFEKAETFFARALKAGANSPEVYYYAGKCRYLCGDHESAVIHIKKAIELKNDYYSAWMALGDAYRETGQLNEALQSYGQGNRINPAKAEVALKIGRVYKDQAFSDKALEMFGIVLKMEPENTAALNEKAVILQNKQEFNTALETIQAAIDINPADITLLATKAEILKETGDFLGALQIYEEMLAKNPGNGGVRINYANVLQDLGRFDEAEQNFLRANKDVPSFMESYSNYLFVQHYNPNKTRDEILETIRKWDSIYAPENPERAVPENKDRSRRLRIGLLSGGFRIHPVGWMILAGLENLNSDEFELYFYSNHTKVDQITQSLHKTAREWRMIKGFSNQRANEMIRQDQIDILVEMSGHAGDSRLRAVAMEPAPVIVKWVGGLFNTTGLKAIDYLLTDHIETPEGSDEYYVEKLVRMPDDYICFSPIPYAPEVKTSPVTENGYITFGCFNNPIKVNPDILEKWAKILTQVPDSRLFLKSRQYGNEYYTNRIEQLMEGFGVGNERLIFEGGSTHDVLLDAYNRVDIALDPWPYSGGLTTCEALWMGVPVITYPGPTFAGRHAATHVHNAGFPEWIAGSWEEYTDKAVAMAADPERLAALRARLRDTVASSPLCDGKRFGKALSKAFREMWIAYAEGRLKESAINVEISESDLTDSNLGEKKVNVLESVEDEVFADSEKVLIGKEAKQLEEREMQESVSSSVSITTGLKKKSQDNPIELISDKQYGLHEVAEKRSAKGRENLAKANQGQQIEKNARYPWVRGGKDNLLVHGTYGVKYSVPESLDVISTYVFLEQGKWYDAELKFLYEYLRPGMKVVDAGAGFGAYALTAALKVGAKGIVYAFEPVENMRKHLDISKVENALTNIEVSGRALGAKSGEMGLSKNATPELTVLEQGGVGVQVVTLDKWWEFEGNPQVDVLKIDVNGREFDVLKGADKMLSETSAVVVLAVTESGTTLQSQVEYLQSKDFVFYDFIGGVSLLSPIQDWNQRDSYTQNIVAVKKDMVSELFQTGWIHDEHVEIVEPEEEYWRKSLRALPWTDSLFAEWEKNALKPEHKDYYRALDYISAAIEHGNTDSESIQQIKYRSVKAKLLLVAAQELITKYNKDEGGVSVAFTLIRVLETLGRRKQAVDIMKKLIVDTKMGQENLFAPLPFFLPKSAMDNARVRTEFQKWLMVRSIESWLQLNYLTTYQCSFSDKQLLEVLHGNIETISKRKEVGAASLSIPANGNVSLSALNLPSQVVKVKVLDYEILIPKNEIFRLKNIFVDNEYSLPEGHRIDRDSVILDVGGNIGAFALYAQKWSPNAKIYSFEPNPQVFPLLQSNTKGHKNISVLNYGLGSSDKVVELYQNPFNTGATSTTHKITGSNVVNVQIKNALSQIIELGVEKIAVLKIDTEGAEVEILESLEPVLDKVEIIMLEYHSKIDRANILSILSSFKIYASEKNLTSEVGTLKFINNSFTLAIES